VPAGGGLGAIGQPSPIVKPRPLEAAPPLRAGPGASV
jgi:hypothetical protein